MRHALRSRHRIFRCLCLRQSRMRMAQVCLTRFSETEPPRRSVEQARTEAPFERSDLFAHRRFRHSQAFAGAHEAAELRDPEEGDQTGKVGDGQWGTGFSWHGETMWLLAGG